MLSIPVSFWKYGFNVSYTRPILLLVTVQHEDSHVLKMSLITIVLLLTLSVPTSALSSDGKYEITNTTIDNSGGILSDREHFLSGTFGQHDTTPQLSGGGQILLTGAVWANVIDDIFKDGFEHASVTSIQFALDASGSVGPTNFGKLKTALENTVSQAVPLTTTRVGIQRFETNTTDILALGHHKQSVIDTAIQNMAFTGGYTDPRTVLDDAIVNIDDETGILLFIVDGNPCSDLNCPMIICGYAPQILAKNIRVVLVGVGSGINSNYWTCLLQDTDDYVFVTDYDGVESILSNIIFPSLFP